MWLKLKQKQKKLKKKKNVCWLNLVENRISKDALLHPVTAKYISFYSISFSVFDARIVSGHKRNVVKA